MIETVDPALFRLRAFEADWIDPLKASLGPDVPVVALLDQSDDEGRSAARLSVALLLEAEAWMMAGILVEYFAAPADGLVEMFGPEREDLKVRFGDVLGEVGLDLGGDRDELDFAHSLSQALDDLTPARREFLRLFYFADSSEWNRRLAEVQEFARAIQSRPGASRPCQDLDRVAWSLDGAESQLGVGATVLPATWRSELVTARHEPHFADRWQALRTVRQEISGAAAWMAEDEWTSSQIQIAAALRIRNEEQPGLRLFGDSERGSTV